MSEYAPTKDQRKMLDSTSANLLVSASAGSGKTATLIEKVVNVLDGNASLDDMLIITFTESASMEMKVRLKDKLASLAGQNSHIEEQLEKLSTANITTLHGFCAKMLRQYFYKLGIKPNFAVLEENNANFLKTKALEQTIREYCKAQDSDFDSIVSIFGGRDYNNLKRDLRAFQDFLASLDSPDDFLDNKAKVCYDKNIGRNDASRILNNYLLGSIKYYVSVLNSQSLAAEQAGALEVAGFIEKQIEKLSRINSTSFVDNCMQLSVFSFDSLVRTKKMSVDDSFKEDFKPIWTELGRKIRDIKEKFFWQNEEQMISGLSSAEKYLDKYIEIEKRYVAKYEELKTKRNGLDFNDLEGYFRRLLSLDDVEIGFKYVFVDEYQDINTVQESIIQKLRRKDTQVIMVGDVKQSIYRFRNSTPEIFVEKSKLYDENKQIGQLVTLNDNFRSEGLILKFVNEIFKKCMDIDFGGVNYNKNALNPCADYVDASKLPKVEINIFDTKKEDGEDVEYFYDDVYSVLGDENEYKEALTNGRKEGLFVAKRINEIVGKVEIYNSKTKEKKLAEYRDITILCRGNEYLKEIANTLFDCHIPISTSFVREIYEEQDVDRLECLLGAVNNSHDDKSLSVVLNFFAGLSFDDLARIREHSPDCKFYYEAVKSCLNDENFDAEIVCKIKKAYDLIADFREQLEYKSIFELLNDFCQEGYYDYVLSLPDGENRLRFVKDYVYSFVGKDYNYDLVGYLDYVKNYAKDNKVKTEFSSGENCVELTTIHGSKGLEYPIVFLVGAGRKISMPKNYNESIFDKNHGVGIYSFDLENYTKCSNIAREALCYESKMGDMAEELRLLYVALTRAKNHLFVTGCLPLGNVAKINSPQEARVAKNYMEWILSSLSTNNFKGLVVNKKNVVQKVDKKDVFYNIVTDDMVSSETKEVNFDFLKEAKTNKKLIKNLQPISTIGRNIALKNSVSSLLLEHSQPDEIVNFAPKKLSVFEGEKGRYSSQELGTYYHKIMEQVDYCKQFEKHDFDRIVKALSIPQEYQKAISFDRIKKCVECLQKLGVTSTYRELPFISYLPYSEIFGGNIDSKVMVQGVADLVAICGEKRYLIDFKTTKAQTADQLVGKYNVQLKLYKICLEKALNTHFDGAYIYSYVLQKLIKVF